MKNSVNQSFKTTFLVSLFLASLLPSLSVGSDTPEVTPEDIIVSGKKVEAAKDRGDYYNIGRFIGELQYKMWLSQQSNTNLQESNSNLSDSESSSRENNISCTAVELNQLKCEENSLDAYSEWIKTCRWYSVINADEQCRAEKKANLDTDLKSCELKAKYDKVNCVN